MSSRQPAIRGRCLGLCCLAFLLSPACLGFGQQDDAGLSAAPSNPAGVRLPDASRQISRTFPPDQAVEVEGVVRVDVEVTGSHQEAASLHRSDFTLLDNGEPQRIVAFRKFSEKEPLSVVVMIDTLGLPESLASFERAGVTGFLRQNAGSLKAPVTIYSLEDSGFFVVAGPSTDGNVLASAVDRSQEFTRLFGPRRASARSDQAVVDLDYGKNPLLTALRAIGTIARRENGSAGKKMLLWVGPGLLELCNRYDESGECASRLGAGPCTSHTGTGQYPGELFDGACTARLKDSGFSFDEVYWVSALMRQARLSLYAFSVGEDASDPDTRSWKTILDKAPSGETTGMELYKKVLAVRSGGKVLPSRKDLAKQVEDCIAGAGTFYSLTFNPPPTNQNHDYRFLTVRLSNAKLHTSAPTGYFNEPYYGTNPDAALRPVSVAELEEVIARHDRIQEVLPALSLTERLNAAKAAELRNRLHGSKEREIFDALADLAQFHPPPVLEIPTATPPDLAAQQRILLAVREYLDHTISRMPNFFATRTTVRYGKRASYKELSDFISSMPLHVEERSKSTVLYRDGKELIEATKSSGGMRSGRLLTYGSFGPLLSMVQYVFHSQGKMTWSRWEQNGEARLAVFRFVISSGDPMVSLTGWDPPYSATISTAYDAEIAVDPATGAILRLQLEADLRDFVPASLSNILVIYGAVPIGGREYILPLRSIGVMTTRTTPGLSLWGLAVQTWGPFETHINDFKFDHYHKFGGTMRILPGFTEVPLDPAVH